MRKKYRLNPFKGPLPIRYVLLITLSFFALTTAFALWLVNEKIEPTLTHYAESETKMAATKIINDAVKSTVVDNKNLSSILTQNSGANVQFDTEKINKIFSQATDEISKNIHKMEKGDRSKYGIPIGLITKNAFLAHLGPKIPIEFNVVGDVETDIKPTVTSYGINNAFVKITVETKVDIQVIAPFSTKRTTIKTSIPLAMGMVQGEVPDFYNGNLIPNPNQSDTKK